MLNRIACIISSFFLKINIISEHEYEAYAYSLEIFLSTIINFLLVVFFSIISGRVWECVCFLSAFALLRMNCGGVHAPNHLLCSLFMLVVLSAFLFCIQNIPLSWKIELTTGLMLFSVVGIWLGAPAQTPNKILNNKEKNVFKKRSRIIISFLFCIVWIGDKATKFSHLSYALAMGCFAATSFMLIAKEKERRNRRQNNEIEQKSNAESL